MNEMRYFKNAEYAAMSSLLAVILIKGRGFVMIAASRFSETNILEVRIGLLAAFGEENIEMTEFERDELDMKCAICAILLDVGYLRGCVFSFCSTCRVIGKLRFGTLCIPIPLNMI